MNFAGKPVNFSVDRGLVGVDLLLASLFLFVHFCENMQV